MNEQLDMFHHENVKSDLPSAPLCGICGEPCGWLPRAGRWGRYCGGAACTNSIRICKNCHQTFARDLGGTRYCSPACREAWHSVAQKVKADHGPCTHCGEPRRGFNLWDLCAQCYAGIEVVAQRMRRHRVPIHMVSRLLTDPTCFNPGCSNDLLEVYRDTHSGRGITTLAVDHDHRHCPGGVSCGICVRGLLCQPCNTSLGMLGEDTRRIAGLIEYLGTFD